MVIFLKGELSLFQQDSELTYQEIACASSATQNSAYRQLKYLAHIPATINILVEARQSEELKNMTQKLENLVLDATSQPCINQSIQLIDSLLAHWNDEPGCEKLLDNYNRSIKPFLDEYCKQATCMQLATLKEIMEEWFLNYKIRVDSSRILLVCSHGVRDGLVEKQFFESWLNQQTKIENGSSQGLIYLVEMLNEQMSTVKKVDDLILGFLGKQEINKRIGKQLLNNEYAMFKDLLAEHATSLLEEQENSTKGTCPYS